VLRYPASVTTEELLAEVARLNADPTVSGVLVQLPLPAGVDEKAVLRAIDPAKDVDGFTPVNTGLMLQGQECFLPCTPAGCMYLLQQTGQPLAGKRAVVLGRSNIVGKPMAVLLTAANATVTLCHSRTQDLAAICREADILVSAIGKAGFVTADMVKPGATVIDVGINRNAEGKLCGDVDFEAVRKVAGWLTPVPGGVGLMTRAMLMVNTLRAAQNMT
jgi:methylenetetrahydrofolate dehydrogenase (NADP+)/methenyltetrahydrofolate cyclohydrolase